MTAIQKPARKPATLFRFPFHSCRNISSPEDERAHRKVYSGHVPASSILELEDDENVREYLVDAPGKEKRQPTLVHQAIRKTLQDTPDEFSILNGGMVLVARDAEIDDKAKVLHLKRPSIINGSQTQGEIKKYFEKFRNDANFFEPSIKYELIVTTDNELIAEISIARNFQNDVRAISIAGRRGQLDSLEEAIQRKYPDVKLRKTETDIVGDGTYLDTEKLIQVIMALMPDELFARLDVSDSKVFTYSKKARCLKIFQRIVDEGDSALVDVYRYCLDIAPTAWELYEKWKANNGFYGSRLKSIIRDGRDIVEIPDGIIFPIIASLAAFVTKPKRMWSFNPPEQFDEDLLIRTAVQAYKEIADSNPQTMGKSKACYTTLSTVTSIYASFAAQG